MVLKKKQVNFRLSYLVVVVKLGEYEDFDHFWLALNKIVKSRIFNKINVELNTQLKYTLPARAPWIIKKAKCLLRRSHHTRKVQCFGAMQDLIVRHVMKGSCMADNIAIYHSDMIFSINIWGVIFYDPWCTGNKYFDSWGLIC